MIKMIFNRNNIWMLFVAILSSILEAIAQVSFVQVAGFLPAGFSGISRLVSRLSPIYLNIEINFSVLYFVLNFIVAIIVFREIGKKFTIFSILQVAFTSLFCLLFHPLFDFNDPLLLSIFGGIVNGVACGISLANNFSSGGTDFLNVYFSHKYNKSIINYVLFINCLIVIIGSISFGIEIGMYSIIYQYVTTQVIKGLHHRYTHSTLTIITNKPEEVKESIFSKVRHGITVLNAEGGYLHKKETMLYMVIGTFQEKIVIDAIKKADPHAFINIQDSKEIVGNYYQLPLD